MTILAYGQAAPGGVWHLIGLEESFASCAPGREESDASARRQESLCGEVRAYGWHDWYDYDFGPPSPWRRREMCPGCERIAIERDLRLP